MYVAAASIGLYPVVPDLAAAERIFRWPACTLVAGLYTVTCAGRYRQSGGLGLCGEGMATASPHPRRHMIWETLRSSSSHFLELTFGWGADNVVRGHLLYISEPLKYSWNNIEYTMVRIHAILFVFTFGNAWGNIVLLNIAYFAGARFRYFRLWQRHPENQAVRPGAAHSIGCTSYADDVHQRALLDMEKQFRGGRSSGCSFGGRHAAHPRILCHLPGALLFFVVDGTEKFQGSGWLFGDRRDGSGVGGRSISDDYSTARSSAKPSKYSDRDRSEYDYHIYSGIDDREPLTELPGVLNNIFFRPNVIHSFLTCQALLCPGTDALLDRAADADDSVGIEALPHLSHHLAAHLVVTRQYYSCMATW